VRVEQLDAIRKVLGDRYRLEREIGHGGMATVYLAEDLKHERPVAIKVLRPELTAALGRERFLREIQIAAKLNHPHILTLHDSGDAGGFLYYVMPYVEGETLQERVAREKQLPVEEAVRIVREVASALAYAHARDVIHRDIKPANILLSNGFALVADFGLARAINRAKSPREITHSGLVVGSPAYMSPEQAAGDTELDGRSDIYSLGCVLYELLAGDPPFTSSNPAAVLARHAAAPVPPIRVVRGSVPGWVEKPLMRALEKAPADRFGKAEDLAEALRRPAGTEPKSRLMPAWVVWAGAMLFAVVAGWGVWESRRSSSPSGASRPDTSHYAVLPFDVTNGVSSELVVEQLVQDALTRWTGISLVDRFQVADMLARRQPGAMSTNEAIRMARTLGAGRFVRGDVSMLPDSLRIHAALYDAVEGGILQEGTVRVGLNLARADSAVEALVDQLLLRGIGPIGRSETVVGTTSLPARLAYTRGQAAINIWDLDRADTAFATALRQDGDYAQAALWLGIVRAWSGTPPGQWRFAAELAAAHRDKLSARDGMLADAVLAQSHGSYTEACPAWRRLTQTQPHDFAGWYGLATCTRDDPGIVRDARSPSHWRFRASYQEAVRAYQRAFELLPSVHQAFSSGSYARVQDLLFTSGDRLRGGRAVPPDTGFFVAHPGWQGDTLVFVPYPANDVAAGKPETMPASMHDAVVHQRQLFRDIATGWTAAFPKSADALEALAVSLELLGDPSALETLRRARLLAATADERERAAIAEVWLRLKFATPDDPAGIVAIRALADSLLARPDSARIAEPALRAPVAALVGRVRLAAELSGQAAERGTPPLPTALARAGQALVTYASFGGPADTLKNLERRVKAGIAGALTAEEQSLARRAWLERAATLAYPDVVLATLTQTTGEADLLLRAQLDAHAGRWEAVRAAFADLRAQRRSLAPEEIVVDALYAEARLLVQLGDDRAAAEWLDPTLASLRRAAPQTLAWVSGSAGLVRAMALRAEIADRAGDRATATRWARPVTILWSDADPFLQSVVQRMTRLTR
jgi:tetratricopeptide (TPR) repeat protein